MLLLLDTVQRNGEVEQLEPVFKPLAQRGVVALVDELLEARLLAYLLGQLLLRLGWMCLRLLL